MINRIYIRLIAVACALPAITGCSVFPDGTIQDMVEDSSLNYDSGRITGELNDAISVDISDNDNSDTEALYYNIELKARSANKDIADANAKKAAEFAGTSIDGYIDANPERYSYALANGAEYRDGDYIMYSTEEVTKRNYNIYVQRANGSDGHTDFPLKELSEFTLDEAKAKVEEIAGLYSEFTLDSEPYDVYAIDAEHASAYQNTSGKKYLQYDTSSLSGTMHEDDDEYIEENCEKITWSREDEVYYMVYGITLKGMPLNIKTVGNGSYYAKEHYALFIISKNEVKKFFIMGLYDEVSEHAISDNICDRTEALNAFASKYQYTSMLNESVVYNVSLVYVPLTKSDGTEIKDKIYNAQPYWMIETKSERSHEKDGKEYIDTVKKAYLCDACTKQIFIGK